MTSLKGGYNKKYIYNLTYSFFFKGSSVDPSLNLKYIFNLYIFQNENAC